MNIDKLIEKSPISLVAHSQRSWLDSGDVGCVIAPVGSGKSAFLVHAGLNYALRGINILHISSHDSLYISI